MARLRKFRKAALLHVLQSPANLSQRPAAGASGLKLILAPWGGLLEVALSMSCMSRGEPSFQLPARRGDLLHISAQAHGLERQAHQD